MHPKVVAILGATASGKSALGEAIGLQFNGEIVSADSRQVYRGLDLGTGKEQLKIQQHCIDCVDPGERMTVVMWKQHAESAIQDICAHSKLPIVVGGSGLYMDALIDNYSFAAEDETGGLRHELESLSTGVLRDRLRSIRPDDTIVDTTNRRHLIRAIERALLDTPPTKQPSPYEWLLIGIDRPRTELYAAIDARVDRRMAEGMEDEVRGLLAAGVSGEWLRSLGLEYRFLTDYIEGALDKDAAIQKLKFATHQFARRQLMWWRRRGDIHWVTTTDEAIAQVTAFMHG